MKRYNKLFLAVAAFGLLGGAATGITLSNRVEEYHEVKADGHTHDNITFDQELNTINFTSKNLSSGNYYLTEDIEIDSGTVNLNINNGVTVNLCLNGHYIKNKSAATIDGALFNVVGGTLNVYDCNNDAHKYHVVSQGSEEYQAKAVVDDSLAEDYKTFTGGYITGFDKYPIFKMTRYNNTFGTVNVYGGTYIGNESNVFYLNYQYAALNIYKANILGNYKGSPVYQLAKSKLYINPNDSSPDDVLFADNHCTGDGGAIYCHSGDIDIEGGRFSDNVTFGYGGAININRDNNYNFLDSNPIVIKNSDFIRNISVNSSYDGGAINISLSRFADGENFNTVNIFGCSFDRNSGGEGAALAFNDYTHEGSTFNISNCDFSRNTATGYYKAGGAINAFADEETNMTINISESEFNYNTAGVGGAIFAEVDGETKGGGYLNLNLNKVSMSNNSASRQGGAIYTFNNYTADHLNVTLGNNVVIKNNTAGETGGGITAYRCNINFNGLVQVYDNKQEGDAPSDIYFLETFSEIYGATIKMALEDIYPSYIKITSLADKSKIGILMETNKDFSKDLSLEVSKANLKYFFSDNTTYYVNINGSTNQLMVGDVAPEPTPTPTPDPVYNKDGVEIYFEDGTELPSDVTIRVEVRPEVKEIDSEVDYSKIKAKLNSNEQISKVYDVKLIKTEGGVETEIQPSDIKEGLKLKVKITLPDDISTKGLKLLHIHSVDDMEFINIDNMEGRELTFEVSKLSQFAFINSVSTGLPGWAIALIIIAILLLLLCVAYILLFFVFNKYIITVHKDIARVFVIKKHHNDVTMLDMYLRRVYRKDVDVYDTKDAAENYLKKQK